MSRVGTGIPSDSAGLMNAVAEDSPRTTGVCLTQYEPGLADLYSHDQRGGRLIRIAERISPGDPQITLLGLPARRLQVKDSGKDTPGIPVEPVTVKGFVGRFYLHRDAHKPEPKRKAPKDKKR